MPQVDELVSSLRPLTFRNGTRVRSDPDFHRDMDRVVRAVEAILGEASVSRPSGPARVGDGLAPLLAIPDFGGFVERPSLMQVLASALDRNNFTIVQGLAGVGKTAAVARLARIKGSQYDHMAWIACQENTGFDHVFLMMSAFLAERGDQYLLQGAAGGARLCSPDELAARLLAHLRAARLLVVLDDFHHALNRNRRVTDPRVLRFVELLLAAEHPSQVVLTTRFTPNLPKGYLGQYGVVQAGGLEPAESRELLRALGGMDEPDDVLDRIHHSVRGHPFALKIFASLTSLFPLDALLADRSLFLDECGAHLLAKLFRTLTHEESAALRQVAVLRGEFALYLLRDLGLTLSVLELLLSRFLLEFRRSASRYAIHPLVREYAYSRSAESERTNLHARAARRFASECSAGHITVQHWADAVEASYHYSRAGDLQNTIGLRVGFTESLHHLGRLFFKRGEYDQAQLCYAAILEIDDADEKAHFHYAASLDLLGPPKRAEFRDAIERHYNQALKTSPNNTQYLDYYGYYLSNTGQREEAVAVFEKGLRGGARCPTLYARYGNLLRTLGRIGQAEDVLRRGCERAYDNGKVFLEYALLKGAEGAVAEELDITREGLRRNPNYRPLNDHLRAIDTVTENRKPTRQARRDSRR